VSEQVSLKLAKALKAMYSTVRAVIKRNGEISECIYLYLGVKQGDSCSALLFMMFVNDILENINTDLPAIFTFNELQLLLILYADDQVLFVSSPKSLQLMLNYIKKTIVKMKIKN